MSRLLWWLVVGAVVLLSPLHGRVDFDGDYYKIFGLDQNNFDLARLKKSYKQLAIEYHPDRNKDANATEIFSKISRAYETLSNEEKRREYDMHGKYGGQQQTWSDPFDLFTRFPGFDFRSEFEDPRAHSIQEIEVRVGLEQAYRGDNVEIEIDKQVSCSQCQGSGARSQSDIETCKTCRGAGMVIQQEVIMNRFIQHIQSTCPKCNGQRKIIQKPCPKCLGTKTQREKKTVSVELEKGVADNERFIVRGIGDGEVIIRVVTKPHPVYTRKGSDLYVEQTLTLEEALVGFSRKLVHLDGTTITLKRTGPTQPSFVDEIKGYGMPKKATGSFYRFFQNSFEYGNLYATYKVSLPETNIEATLSRIQEKLERRIEL